MFNRLKCVTYNPGNSFFHQLSPLWKLFFLFILIATLFAVQTLFSLLVLMSFLIAAIYLSGGRFEALFSAVKPILFLAVASLITNFLFNSRISFQGHLNFEQIPWGTLENALEMLLRLLLFSMVTLLFTTTTEPDALMKALESALSPLSRIGLPVSDYIGICTLSLSLFPMVISTSQSLFSRYLYRAKRFHKNRFHRKALFCAALIAPLIMLLFKKGDEIILDRKPA